MKRKIFISINLSDVTRKRLIKAARKWQDLPVKWIKEENLHVTVFFLGYVETEMLPEICQKVREAVEEEKMFDLEFDQIELGPTVDDPQMIWLSGEASEQMRVIHEKIEKVLGFFSISRKTFRPHVTLGRIRKHKWAELTKKPEIKEIYPALVSVESIDIMASDFGDGQSEYAQIESCLLQ